MKWSDGEQPTSSVVTHPLFGPRNARVPGFPAFELARRSPLGWGQLAVASLMLLCRTVGSSITASSTAFRRFTSSRRQAGGGDHPISRSYSSWLPIQSKRRLLPIEIGVAV